MKFSMNNRKWEIEEKSQEEIKTELNKRNDNNNENVKSIENRFFGLTFSDTQKIWLDKDLPEDRKRATLYHELTHCYIVNYITHLDKQYDEEEVADIMSNSHDIIHEISEKYFDLINTKANEKGSGKDE